MAKKTESVKIDIEVVSMVKENKEKTGVPIGTFFEQAAKEKLEFAVGVDSFYNTGNIPYKSGTAKVFKKSKK